MIEAAEVTQQQQKQERGSRSYVTNKSPIKCLRCLQRSALLLWLTLYLQPIAPSRSLVSAPLVGALLQPVPNRHTLASIPGDLVIGILVPVHERPEPKQAQTGTCGAVREQYGIQRVEAALWTVDAINNDPKILPNITLGLEIRDSCWHSPIALEQSIEFIRDAMAASEQTQIKPPPSTMTTTSLTQAGSGSGSVVQPAATNAASASEQQPATASSATNISSSVCGPLLLRQQQQQLQAKKVKNVVGVVGPASSGDTVQVQNLLQMFHMPQVGYSATSRDLSNKNFYKYFLRVVPSDKLQARVLIDLMLAHNWTYITVAYTEGSYGASLMNAFRERAQEVGICFATLESMPPNADDAKFDELIEAIQKHPNARVVICMCEGRTVGKLFSGFKRKNIENEYLVVGSDGWADRFDVVERQEEFALGGISIRIHSAYVNDFDDHYFSLNPYTNHRNPWFAEFWETRFKCNLVPLESQASLAAQNLQQNSSLLASSAVQRLPSGANSLQWQQNNGQLSGQRFGSRAPGSRGLYPRNCTGRESLRHNHKQDAKMAFVQKSIITMALGLDSMQRAICPAHKPGLCPEMLPVNGSTLIQHLMNVSFSFLGEKVYFDEQGDPPGQYEILNFQRRRSVAAAVAAGGVAGSGEDSDSPHLAPDPMDDGSSLNGGGSGDQSVEFGAGGSTSSSDYSIAAAATDGALSPERRRQNPLYDSYSTLRVHRKLLSSSGSVNSSPEAPLPATTGGDASERVARRIHDARRKSRLQLPASGYSSTSGYEYVHVGSWKSDSGLSLFGQIQWPSSGRKAANQDSLAAGADGQWTGAGAADFDAFGAPSVNALPKSVCSLPCAKGHAKKIQSDSVKCCWVCVPCRSNEYLFNEFKCKACEKGWWPNGDQTGCDQIPIQHLNWRSAEALTAISIAVFGLLLTFCTAIVFVKHNNTPVVKSTTRELSYMILFAMFLCYLNTFFLIAKPSKWSCFVTRVLPGFAFAMMYGALVTKTNRIARILAGSKKKIITRRPRFMSATSQVAITWIIVLIECLIIVFMLVREPADKMHDYPSDMRVNLVCNTTTMGIIAPLGFDFFLIAMCTLYAFKTRNVPENFNEAKFIGFTMYTTLVIWVAFVAIYLSSDHKVTTLCLCISFSALFALFLLFFPRCYIILLKPEKNNRSFFTTTKNVRCHIGYQIGSAGAAAAAAAAHLSSGGGSGSGQQQAARQLLWQSQQQDSNLAGGSETTNQPLASGQHQFAPLSSAETKNNSLDSGDSSDFHNHNNNHNKLQLIQWQPQDSSDKRSTRATSGPQDTSSSKFVVAAAAGTGSSRGQQRGRGKQAADSRSSQRSAFSGTGSRSDSSAGGGQTTQSQAAAAGGRSGVWLVSGTQNEASGESPDERPLAFNSLLDRLLFLLARRSRRKESNKVTSIQQHLRAIRHAENLDRQTHFRRSQVQRSVQRFDSHGGRNSRQQQPPSYNNNQDLGPGVNFVATTSGESSNANPQQPNPSKQEANFAGKLMEGAGREEADSSFGREERTGSCATANGPMIEGERMMFVLGRGRRMVTSGSVAGQSQETVDKLGQLLRPRERKLGELILSVDGDQQQRRGDDFRRKRESDEGEGAKLRTRKTKHEAKEIDPAAGKSQVEAREQGGQSPACGQLLCKSDLGAQKPASGSSERGALVVSRPLASGSRGPKQPQQTGSEQLDSRKDAAANGDPIRRALNSIMGLASSDEPQTNTLRSSPQPPPRVGAGSGSRGNGAGWREKEVCGPHVVFCSCRLPPAASSSASASSLAAPTNTMDFCGASSSCCSCCDCSCTERRKSATSANRKPQAADRTEPSGALIGPSAAASAAPQSISDKVQLPAAGVAVNSPLASGRQRAVSSGERRQQPLAHCHHHHHNHHSHHRNQHKSRPRHRHELGANEQATMSAAGQDIATNKSAARITSSAHGDGQRKPEDQETAVCSDVCCATDKLTTRHRHRHRGHCQRRSRRTHQAHGQRQQPGRRSASPSCTRPSPKSELPAESSGHQREEERTDVVGAQQQPPLPVVSNPTDNYSPEMGQDCSFPAKESKF